MSEPIILPPEPDGPVWDRFGNRWDRGAIDLWDQEGSVSGDDTFEWEWWELFSRAPLFTTKPEPPWTPEVGGTVETEAQYAAMPRGSIVASSFTGPYVRGGGSNGDYWFGIGCDDKFSNLYMASFSRTILRVGWVS